MRKKAAFLITALLAATFALAACQAPAAGAASDNGTATALADLYVENGVIYTVDDHDTVVDALAVKDGVIVFAGTAEDGRAYKDAAAEVLDLAGNMLLPGMIDAHIHTTTLDFFDMDLTGIASLDTLMATIEAYVAAHPGQAAYTGFGYITSIFEGEELEKGPRKERLDAISPDVPMYIYAFDGHAAWLNTAALAASDITEDTPDVTGGEIVKDDATGALWGTLKDTAVALMPSIALPDAQMGEALAEFQAGLNALGYTSIMTVPGNGFFSVPWQGYALLEAEGLLTLRVRGADIVTPWNTEANLAALARDQQQYSSPMLKLTGAKIFLDGVMDSESAYLLEPYADNPGHSGQPIWQQDALNATVATLNAQGALAHFHAVGDGATRMALDAVEYARAKTPQADIRNAITHLQLVAPDDFSRFDALGVVAVAQPYWHFKEPGYWAVLEQPALGSRAEQEYPLRSFLESDAVLALSSDYPVTMLPNPFIAIEMGVTRNLPIGGPEIGLSEITDMDDPTYLLWPEERLSVQEMIRGYTADAAISLYAEDVTGSLEVGKSADMIVVDQDLLTIDPLDISDTQVLYTFLQGELVYSAA